MDSQVLHRGTKYWGRERMESLDAIERPDKIPMLILLGA